MSPTSRQGSDERAALCLAGSAASPSAVELDEALKRRLRAYVDRVNSEMVDPADRLDPDDDVDLADALLGAAEGGLEADERATVWPARSSATSCRPR